MAEQTSGAASTVARKLAVGDCWTGTEALDFAQDASSQVDSLRRPRHRSPPTTPRGTAITVTVTAQADIVGFIPMPDGGTVTREVTTRLEDTTAATC